MLTPVGVLQKKCQMKMSYYFLKVLVVEKLLFLRRYVQFGELGCGWSAVFLKLFK